MAPPEAAGAVLAVLGDRTRRAIVELLAERPRAVGELADLLPVTRPAVSLHLRALKDARLVHDTPHGTRRVYALDPEGLALLRTYLDRLWAGALDRFAAAAEAAHRADLAEAGDPAAVPIAGPTPKGPTP
jgi:DNA-binding transcriptional ArsR family regulator